MNKGLKKERKKKERKKKGILQLPTERVVSLARIVGATIYNSQCSLVVVSNAIVTVALCGFTR